MRQSQYTDLGTIEYKEAWDKQENLHAEMLKKKQDADDSFVGHVLFCEHHHVYTLGKSGVQNNLLINDEFLKKINASYYKSNRGGDITYHGPGQIVGYPIIDLEKLNMGVKEYVHLLEDGIIRCLADYQIESTRLEGATGVWLDAKTPKARKICAIGVRVSKAVTMHGFALNVNTDLNYFSYINPCGFVDKGVTSMQKELGKEVPMDEVKAKLLDHFSSLFSLEIHS